MLKNELSVNITTAEQQNEFHYSAANFSSLSNDNECWIIPGNQQQ